MAQRVLVVLISAFLLAAINLMERHLDEKLFPRRRKEHWGRRREDREDGPESEVPGPR